MADTIQQAVLTANGDILASVSEQIRELHPGIATQMEVDALVKELQNLAGLGAVPGDTNNILADAVSGLKNIQSGASTWQDSGAVLGDLDTLKGLLANTPEDPKYKIITSVITQIEQSLNYRPDVSSVLSDLDAIKTLKAGPADATAFHDFNALQIAFENTWLHPFANTLPAAPPHLHPPPAPLHHRPPAPTPA